MTPYWTNGSETIFTADMQPERETVGADDQWLILALRILAVIDREDVADGLEAEFERLRK